MPQDLVLHLLSVANDEVIKNVATLSKRFDNMCSTMKDTITKNKYSETGIFDLYAQLPQASINVIQPTQHFVNANSREKHMSFYTDDMMDSNILFLNQDDDVKDSVLVSLLIKGNVKCISLCCVHQIIQPIDISALKTLGILREDEDEYIEILQPFVSMIFLSRTIDTILFLQTQGHIELKMRYNPKTTLQKSALTRSPLIIYNKVFNSVVPQILIIPISCTWANDYVFICFNKKVDKDIGLIQVKDRHHFSIYQIAGKRLLSHYIGKHLKRFAWASQISATDKSIYIVPLSGDGGCFYVTVNFKTMVKELSCSVLRWQEKVDDIVIN